MNIKTQDIGVDLNFRFFPDKETTRDNLEFF